MKLTTIFHVGAAIIAVLALSACGQSRNEDVVADDIFAPASDTGDDSIDDIQTVFDDPFADEANLVTDAFPSDLGSELDPLIDQAYADDTFADDPFADDPFLAEETGMTSGSVSIVPVVNQPIYQQAMPVGFHSGAGTFNCSMTPSSKSQLMLFRQYCGGVAPSGYDDDTGPRVYGANEPAQQVFFSPDFDCSQNPRSKAELAFYRANCLSNIGAPIVSPEVVPVAVAPDSGFVDDFSDDFDDFEDDFDDFDDTPQSYDCNILPTSRAELELYQQFCG